MFEADFGVAEKDAVCAVLDSGWLTAGAVTEEFERAFGGLVGAPHAVAVSNGTAALQLALTGLEIGPGDEVICPALTFVATANAVLHAGATPVFADVSSEDDLSLDPAAVSALINRRTRAVIAVHYAGFPCDMDELRRITGEHGIALVEDAAHAPGARLGDRPCGDLADVGCFSFYGNKNMTTGEGGMVTTRDPLLAERVRRLRSHGMTTDARTRHAGAAVGYDVIDLGHNFRPDELSSAVGLAQLQGLVRRNERRAALAQRYRAKLDGAHGLHMPYRDPRGRSSHHVLPLLLPRHTDRDDFRAALAAQGVQTTLHYPPVHLLEYYRRRFGHEPGLLPRTEDVAAREVTLPLHPRLSFDDLDYVCEAVLTELLDTEKRSCASSG